MSDLRFDNTPDHEFFAYEPPVRLAALGDLHCTERSQVVINQLFRDAQNRADILLLCGDITDNGRATEMEVFLNGLRPSLDAGLTTVAILGEHDYHSGEDGKLVWMMRQAGIKVLYENDNLFVYKDTVGFVGVKGYWGGFAPYFLPGFGEKNTKHLITETLTDVRRLAKGLRSLNTRRKVALLHYSPIKETLKGEAAELQATMGSEWLAMPLDDEGATICFHGHAHGGSYSGLTKKGVPIYNVALPVLKRVGLPLPSIHLI